MKTASILITLLLAVNCGKLRARQGQPWFVGIQPGITVEPFYEKGELDLNIMPLAVEPGYMFRARKSLTLAMGLQLGVSLGAQSHLWILV